MRFVATRMVLRLGFESSSNEIKFIHLKQPYIQKTGFDFLVFDFIKSNRDTIYGDEDLMEYLLFSENNKTMKEKIFDQYPGVHIFLVQDVYETRGHNWKGMWKEFKRDIKPKTRQARREGKNIMKACARRQEMAINDYVVFRFEKETDATMFSLLYRNNTDGIIALLSNQNN